MRKITAWISAAAMTSAMLVPVTVSYAEDAEQTPRTITVGADADDDFSSIRDAVKSITVSPSSEAERITINVDPGDYEEQVKIEGLKYITLQQTPGTTGRVNLHWYYCTGYCAGDCGLDGNYDPKLNWSDPRTWNGYKEGDEKFTAYRLGQQMTKGSTISYYDTDGVAHKDVKVQKDHLGDFNDQAALFINNSSSDITVKDFNIVNSIPVMVTAGEKKVGVAPQEDRNADHATSYVLPRRDNLAICDESTEMDGTQRLKDALAIRDDVQKVKTLEALTDLTAGESAYLARSDKYNERGHAVSANGDRIIFEGIRLRGNQDSLYISTGRMYFKNCDLIGGTDYIYGDATAVFDNCKLGAEGMSNKSYGATVTAANHDGKNPYGYLFFNCELYNVLDNITTSQLGRPWRQDAQITFYNTLIDDTKTTGASKAGISDKGWSDMSGNEAAKARFYEYGTKTRSGAAVDTSKRLVNENGFGSVLNDLQILEFNPRNYFNSDFWLTTKKKSVWDPMNFTDTYLKEVDAQIAASTIDIPAGEETEIALPVSSDPNIEFSWASASTNAIVSADGTKLTVVRPAAGEAPINTTVTLYAKNKTTGLGDKKDIPVTIAATTDTTNVFNIPVKISQSASADNNYSISILKNGALIKSQTIAVSGTSADAVIENVPASADGIDYDIRIVSESDEFTIIAPEDGAAAVKGITGNDVALDITAQKLVDSTQKLDIASKAADGDKIYDIIALAKAAGATGIESSDSVKITFDVTVNAKPGKNGFIDISSGTPKSSNSAEAARFTEIKINQSWVQLDSVDCTQGFSGSSNGDGQCLNLCGKFSYPCTQTVSAVINYKDRTVSVEGSNLKEAYTFKGFPESAAKGTIKMGVFPGSTTDDYEISNVKVTYKKVITGAEPTPEPLPSGQGTYKFPANNESVINGNQCDNNDSFVFVDGVKDEVKALFADQADGTEIDAALVKNYKNYISGTASNGSHPQIKLDAPRGYYRIYYVGFNHGNNVTASVGGKTFTAEPGVDFAAKENNTSYVLKYYVIDIELAESGDTVTFDSTDQWLPDLYCIAVTGREAPVQPEPTPVPDGTGIYKYPFDRNNVTGGNQCDTKEDTFTILEGVDEMIKYLFGNAERTKADSTLFAHYLNYIGGTDSKASHPSIKITPERAGKYNIYLVGYNHGNNISCTIGDKTYTAEQGILFAVQDSNTARKLKSYKIANVELPEGESTITFDSTDQWLPDTYAVVIAGTAEKLPITGGTGNTTDGTDKTLADLVEDASVGTTDTEKTVNITAAADQGTVEIPADVKVVIESADALKSTVLKAKDKNITVDIKNNGDTSKVTGSNIVFDADGRITPSEDTVIKTANDDKTVDLGLFKGAAISNDKTKVTFTLKNAEGKTASKAFDLSSSVSGNAVFGLFIKGVSADENLTITSVEVN